MLDLQMDDFLPCAALGAAVLADTDGHHVRATRLLAAVDSALGAAGQVLDPGDAIGQKALRDRLTTALGPEAFESAYATGAGAELHALLES